MTCFPFLSSFHVDLYFEDEGNMRLIDFGNFIDLCISVKLQLRSDMIEKHKLPSGKRRGRHMTSANGRHPVVF